MAVVERFGFDKDQPRGIGQRWQGRDQIIEVGLCGLATALAREPGEHSLHDHEALIRQEWHGAGSRNYLWRRSKFSVELCGVEFSHARIAHASAHGLHLSFAAELVIAV